MPEPLSGADALTVAERRILDALISVANWRELYFQAVRDLEATRAAWATRKALRCCAVVCAPANARQADAFTRQAHPVCEDCGYELRTPAEVVRFAVPAGPDVLLCYGCAAKRVRAA